MYKKTIGFIGAGNMAASLIGGLIAAGFESKKIWASNPNVEQLQDLEKKFNIHVTENNREVIEHVDVVILAVKPQLLKKVTEEIADKIQTKKPLIISIASGVQIENIEQWLKFIPHGLTREQSNEGLAEGGSAALSSDRARGLIPRAKSNQLNAKVAIVRCMPNTPALIQSGATGLYANHWVTEEQKSLAESILRAVGIVVWVEEESQLDIVTALSGSGPAYFFLIIDILEQAAKDLGLPAETAKLLTLQTALGAARMALESKESVTELRQRVTSPGGTTERAVNLLLAGNVTNLFTNALKAASERAKELAKEFSE